MNQIAKLQSTIGIDCNSNTEIFSIQNQLVNFSLSCVCSGLVNSYAMGMLMFSVCHEAPFLLEWPLLQPYPAGRTARKGQGAV